MTEAGVPPQQPAGTKRFDITIAGETNLDLILYGLPVQMPVERELLASGFQTTLGGSSSILAHNLAMLGTRVGFLSQVGHDELGELAYQRLRESGADLSRFTRRDDLGTGVTVLLHHGDTRHILTYLGAMAKLTVADLDQQYLASARHFHLSSLFLQTGLHAGLPGLFRELRATGMTISLDTNDDPEDRWSGVLDELLDEIDLLLPNEDELLRIARQPTLEAALDALSPRVPLIVVKCGRRGAVIQQGAHREVIAPLLVTPVDTIGAGDSFNAGFLHRYLQGESPARCAAMANVTGALSTQAVGGTEAFRDAAMRAQFLSRLD
ncbi:carbohydrate kinase family protein [Acidipila sp. EB88]|uniref:carbohydrate kinase family protein n=1 Tax=Acidipila sp. EB88 TaxID=2305226 RepID=UPI000F5F9190|nr:carbohydrate kinase family protein [Acidipila sp. EB88]RRA49825.1 carbohydrate kinase family protein [Acidipila sp. EB88]